MMDDNLIKHILNPPRFTTIDEHLIELDRYNNIKKMYIGDDIIDIIPTSSIGATASIYNSIDGNYVIKRVNINADLSLEDKFLTSDIVAAANPNIFDILRIESILKRLSVVQDIDKYSERFIQSYIMKDINGKYVYYGVFKRIIGDNVRDILKSIINNYICRKELSINDSISNAFNGKIRDTESLILKIADDVSKALCIIHTNGIIHNDLKLDNIMYDRIDNTFKIIDYGISSDCFLYDTLWNSPEVAIENKRDKKYFYNRIGYKNFKHDTWTLGHNLYYVYYFFEQINQVDNHSNLRYRNLNTICKKRMKQVKIYIIKNQYDSADIFFNNIQSKKIRIILKALLREWRSRFNVFIFRELMENYINLGKIDEDDNYYSYGKIEKLKIMKDVIENNIISDNKIKLDVHKTFVGKYSDDYM